MESPGGHLEQLPGDEIHIVGEEIGVPADDGEALLREEGGIQRVTPETHTSPAADSARTKVTTNFLGGLYRKADSVSSLGNLPWETNLPGVGDDGLGPCDGRGQNKRPPLRWAQTNIKERRMALYLEVTCTIRNQTNALPSPQTL